LRSRSRLGYFLGRHIGIICLGASGAALLTPGRLVEPFRIIARDPLVAIQWPAVVAAESSSGFLSKIWRVWGATRENEKLRAEVASLRNQNRKLENELRTMRSQLESIARLKEMMPSAEPLIVRVIAADTAMGNEIVTVTGGKGDGVKVGQAVTIEGALLGRICEVGSLQSRVRLVTDSRSKVGVFALRSGQTCVYHGKGTASGELAYLSKDADIDRDDVVLTAGLPPTSLSVGLPRGIPVAKVLRADINRRDPASLKVEAEPLARLAGLETVEVLLTGK